MQINVATKYYGSLDFVKYNEIWSKQTRVVGLRVLIRQYFVELLLSRDVPTSKKKLFCSNFHSSKTICQYKPYISASIKSGDSCTFESTCKTCFIKVKENKNLFQQCF